MACNARCSKVGRSPENVGGTLFDPAMIGESWMEVLCGHMLVMCGHMLVLDGQD